MNATFFEHLLQVESRLQVGQNVSNVFIPKIEQLTQNHICNTDSVYFITLNFKTGYFLNCVGLLGTLLFQL